MKLPIQLLLVCGIIISLPSCKVLYPSLMFQQKDYQYFELAQKQIEQYIIQPGDELTIKIYSRDGFKLVDVIGAPEGSAPGENSLNSFLVDNEGFAKLPVLGDFYVKGYTESELERVLAEKFSGLFTDPYVILKVANRRAFVFVGSSGSVVSLNRSPTTLFEVLGRTGGLPLQAKAYKVKIIRGDNKNPEVHVIDLSTLEGIRKADLIIQGNDIIYIETRKNVAADVLSQIAPYVSLVTTVATLIILTTALGTR